METTTEVQRGAWCCFDCGEVMPRTGSRCCGLPRYEWESEAFSIEVEVFASWSKPHSGLFDKGGGCIEPPSSGDWEEFYAEVDGKEFTLTDDETEDAQNSLAGCDDDRFDPRDEPDEVRE
jgi:hypothetical protein